MHLASITSITLIALLTQSAGADVSITDASLAFSVQDEEEKNSTIADALMDGTIHFNNRLRFEYVDLDGTDTATALTNRLRLGYETATYENLSAFIEMENVSTPTESRYFVPATGQGDPSRAPVADPEGTEVNQAYGRFATDSLNDSGTSLDLKAGRQRIILDDSRFVGNVGWRQFEQTYDAVRIQSNLGTEKLQASYAYIWHVQRIFGPDGANWDSDSHLVNLSYDAAPEVKITPFAYLLDFRDESTANSVNTFGVRLNGRLIDEESDDASISLDYEATYAHQQDGDSNGVDFDTQFIGGQIKLSQKDTGSVTAGYQLLGSDSGTFGFRFPFGTNHKFQGFADQFLITPPTGLQDLYVTGAVDLGDGLVPYATYHLFWSDTGSVDQGYEIDFGASKKLSANWSVTLKAAIFDGHAGLADTTKFWVQTTFSF
ncbi:MAG: alginate export family protein [Phycisphaerales bacterium JB043]